MKSSVKILRIFAIKTSLPQPVQIITLSDTPFRTLPSVSYLIKTIIIPIPEDRSYYSVKAVIASPIVYQE